MKYIIQYNLSVLLLKFLLKVFFPIRAFFIGIWYRLWGFPAKQHFLDHFKNMSAEENQDFVMVMSTPAHLAYLDCLAGFSSSLVDSVGFFKSLDAVCASGFYGFSINERLCRDVQTFPAGGEESELVQYLARVRETTDTQVRKLLLMRGVPDELLENFRKHGRIGDLGQFYQNHHE